MEENRKDLHNQDAKICMEEPSLGRIEVSTVPMPEEIEKLTSGIFTYSGSILVDYHTEGEPDVEDYYQLAVINPDGSGFHKVFAGQIPKKPKANGIRFMPFYDKKRILLGDYVMECSPDIDHCEKAEILPLFYPEGLQEDAVTLQSWTEIIIARDNEHICWTTIRGDLGSVNFVGRLKREEDCYRIENPQIISNLHLFEPDPSHEGSVCARVTRNGEVKQFIRGGLAISEAGSLKAGTLDSVIQYLDKEKVELVTDTPSYEETTIFSMDEKLGLVMSTRNSPETNCSIFGLVPRPIGPASTLGLAMPIYMYSVLGVRTYREGNIGPVLIETARSMKEEGYRGIGLNAPDGDWVYYSPMSWHPDGRHAIWNEQKRSARREGKDECRIRMVTLLDYKPGTEILPVPTPEEIPYAIKGGLPQIRNLSADEKVTLTGSYSGRISYCKQGRPGMQTLVGTVETIYENYSQDGKKIWNGYEKIQYAPVGRTIYEADITVDGEEKGRMDLRAVFEKADFRSPVKLVRETWEDGRPASYGCASWKGVTLRMEDMGENP